MIEEIKYVLKIRSIINRSKPPKEKKNVDSHKLPCLFYTVKSMSLGTDLLRKELFGFH